MALMIIGLIFLGLALATLVGLSLVSIFVPVIGNFVFGGLFLIGAIMFGWIKFKFGKVEISVGAVMAMVGIGIILFSIYQINVPEVAPAILSVAVPASIVGTTGTELTADIGTVAMIVVGAAILGMASNDYLKKRKKIKF